LTELEELERDEILVSLPDERARIGTHFESLIAKLSTEFDVDTRGMKKQ
jgi:hypothetical protein